jgi:hypothetical protein
MMLLYQNYVLRFSRVCNESLLRTEGICLFPPFENCCALSSIAGLTKALIYVALCNLLCNQSSNGFEMK